MGAEQYSHWAESTQWSIESGGDSRIFNVVPDLPDYRDFTYTPPLIQVKAQKLPPEGLVVLNQQAEGSCTGFGLASTINFLRGVESLSESVSPRMLYEMARKHDEWPGMKYEGSSCRGAIKGWYAMGVCSEAEWPYALEQPGKLTVDRAKDARKTRVGAYYRINHRLADFHAALNEAGAVFVSASVHEGWNLRGTGSNSPYPVIEKKPIDENRPGHAFAIVGYNQDGFIVQNSWGRSWGRVGFAVWSYEDWYENIRDAWVFRLSLSTPAIWQVSTRFKLDGSGAVDGMTAEKPIRSEIAGHFVHIDDGGFHDHGPYWSNLDDVRETVSLLAADGGERYRHLLFYSHGGLNTPADSAKRTRGMKEVFKANGIYPFHLMYDTTLGEEVKDIILKKLKVSEGRVGALSDGSDYAIEKLLRGVGRAILREMKRGAELPFAKGNAGWHLLREFLHFIQNTHKSIAIHLVGHSTGAILLAYLLAAMKEEVPTQRVKTVTLMAPAATTSLFYSHFLPLIKTEKSSFGIDAMTVYNLTDNQERRDQLAGIYGKSLLYLVSRSFEDILGGERKEDTAGKKFGARLLGMQRYSVPVDRRVGKKIEFVYSGTPKAKSRCSATSHGTFDNDVLTMNDILLRILGTESPTRLFNRQDLAYDRG